MCVCVCRSPAVSTSVCFFFSFLRATSVCLLSGERISPGLLILRLALVCVCVCAVRVCLCAFHELTSANGSTECRENMALTTLICFVYFLIFISDRSNLLFCVCAHSGCVRTALPVAHIHQGTLRKQKKKKRETVQCTLYTGGPSVALSDASERISFFFLFHISEDSRRWVS